MGERRSQNCGIQERTAMKRYRQWIGTILLCACNRQDEPKATASVSAEALVQSYRSLENIDVSSAISVSNGWVVASESDGAVYLVSKADSVLWRTPGRGRGPGELLSIRAIASVDSSLRVYDARQRKVVHYHRTDGHLVGQTPLSSATDRPGLSVIGFLQDGRWLLRSLPADYSSLTGAVRPLAQIELRDSSGSGVSLGGFRESEFLRSVQQTGAAEMLRPLGKRAGIAITSSAVFAFDGDSLFRYALKSARLQRESVELPTSVITSRMTSEIRKWGEGQIESAGPLASRLSALSRKVPPINTPPLWGAGGPSIVPPILASPDGSIFLRRFTGGKSEEWWRLSPRGTWNQHRFDDGQQVVAFSDTTALVLADREGSTLLWEFALWP